MKQDNHQNTEKDKQIQANNSQQSTNRIMGIAAIFISVLSMIAVIYQSYLAREENELTRIQQSATVLPYLSYWYSNIDGEYKFVVANKGVGPAFIKEVNLMAFDSVTAKITTFHSSSDLIHFMERKSEVIDTTPWVKYNLQANMLISKNETINVFSFPFYDDNHQKLIKKEFNKMFSGFNIIYDDVYGSSWILDSKTKHPTRLDE